MGQFEYASNRYLLSGNAIKLIAVISMVIDHFGSIVMDGVIAPYKTGEYLYFTEDMPFLIQYSFVIKNICEILGSIAFPIFCFMIAEGFLHTHHKQKYALRVGLFALLSEIPFDLAHYQKLCSFSLQNVMFTLCVGILTLYGISQIEKILSDKKVFRWGATFCITFVGMAIAYAMRSEYVFIGVLVIVLLYVLREYKYLRMLAFAPMIVVSGWSLLAILFLLLYDGTRGKGNKYFFYAFYPSHFLLFAAISYLLSIRAIV